MATAKKVMVIGLDAAITPLMYKYAQEGHMPRVKRLLDHGVYGINCMPPFPSITPPNWATIATGATMITHNVTCFNVHTPGDELTEVHQGFDSSDVHAEFIWEAAERVGKKSIVINYPTSYPARMKEGIQLFGVGLAPNEWRTRDVKQWEDGFKVSVAYDQVWTTGFKMVGTDIEPAPARKWENTPKAAKMLEAELPLEYRKPRSPVKDYTWYALLVDSEGKGFDRVIISETKDCANAMADLKVGQWSDTVVRTFDTKAGPQDAAFRIKLLELSADGEDITIYRTSLCALQGWDFPEGIAKELPLKGLPLPYPAYQPLKMGWIDVQTMNELVEMSHEYLGEAAHYLLTNKEWDIYYMHLHTPDWAYHAYSNLADPTTAESEEEYKIYKAVDEYMYESIDRLIDRITSAADDDETVIVLTSDHGAKPTGNKVYPGQILADAGLTVFKQADESDGHHEDGEGVAVGGLSKVKAGASGDIASKFEYFGEIDWSKTRAVVQRSCHVFVNLKGRNPHGIVDPKDYEDVQDEIIAALHNYTDPKTGKKPITLALKREDARMIFMGGEYVGDVVYAIDGRFYGQHGGHLGTEKYGQIGDLRTLFMMSGPGVKQGEVVERTIFLQDVVPTVCYLAGLPVPAQCEGSIVYQALEDPDMRLHELEKITKRYDKMRRSLDRAPMC
ncbi:MAG: alkaline phosphatase family protein [Chloroflexota bacterium]